MPYSIYLVYLPYLLVKKGAEVACKIVFIACIVIVLFELKWLI